MKISSLIFFVIFSFIALTAHAQIVGRVTDTEGEGLPFATIYIEGTTTGVSTNGEGDYEFYTSKRDKLQISCQYLGYESAQKSVEYNGKRLTLDFILETESIVAPTVEVSADAEDPAYAIIRKAIEKRKFHKEKIQSLSSNSYIKGRFELENVPKQLLEMIGNEMDVFDVDSNGQGIIYLSESESSYYKSPPDKVKEVMHSSLISGFDNQFSFNNAMSMDFSIYDNQLFMVRNIVSPIGNSAMLYYKYKLLGTTFDDKGRLLNKIQVIPKSKSSPTFIGVIYVLEDFWSVPSGELNLNSDHAQQAIVDSVRYVFSSIEVEEDAWVDVKKHIWMRIGMFGFKASGGFNGVFSDIELNPAFEDDFFNREVFKVENQSNQKDRVYWDSIRPIPLTEQEQLNYVTMDSLKVIRKSRMDSLVNNPPKFKIMDLFNGYSRYYKNGFKQFSYTPLNEQSFNVVQGFSAGIGASVKTNTDSFHMKGWEYGGHINYGFSDKNVRGGINYTRISNNDNDSKWSIAAGRYIDQYREADPISGLANTVYSLLDENNLAKYYEKDAVAAQWSVDRLDGISVRAFGEFARRRALVNTSDYSWAKANEKYESNNPLNPTSFVPAFSSNSNLTVGVQSQITFGQRYIRYPNRVFKFGSKYPNLNIAASFDHNFELKTQFIHTQLGVEDTYTFNVAGDGAWNVTGGVFLLDKPQYFIDFKHFDGNQTKFGYPSQYIRAFHTLPYYSNSTNDHYLEAHYQHHFRGFILDKIPLIRTLKWNMAAGSNFLYTPEQKTFTEVYVGIENIGISFFRVLRIDGVWSIDQNGDQDLNYMIGIDISGFINQRTFNKKQVQTRF